MHPNGTILSEHDQLVAVVDDYYENIMCSDLERNFSLDLNAIHLPSVNLLHLDRPFTLEDIKAVVKSTLVDKAPGP